MIGGKGAILERMEEEEEGRVEEVFGMERQAKVSMGGARHLPLPGPSLASHGFGLDHFPFMAPVQGCILRKGMWLCPSPAPLRLSHSSRVWHLAVARTLQRAPYNNFLIGIDRC